jgi:ferritin-like metal-binding protein YciE
MARINSFDSLLVEQLRDIYDSERRMTKAIPKMVEAAANDELCAALQEHLAETQQHAARLEKIFGMLGEPARGKTCAGMRGILEEAEEHMAEEYANPCLRDAAIIGAAQRAEHYEIAAYGTAIAHARQLGRDDVADLLDESLAEEKAADERLSDVAESVVNLEAVGIEQDTDAEPALDSVEEPLLPREPAPSGRTRLMRGKPQLH